MAVRLPRRGSVDHLADASALPRVHLELGRDAVLGIACGRRAWASAIKQLSNCKEGVVCVPWAHGGRSASPRWCSFTDSRWDWTGAVGLKLIPTPQTDPTEGNRSARSEPAVERMPDQACLSTLSAGPLLDCDTRPIHSVAWIVPPRRRPVAVPMTTKSKMLGDFWPDSSRGRAMQSGAEQSREALGSASRSLMSRDESLMAGWSVWYSPLLTLGLHGARPLWSRR